MRTFQLVHRRHGDGRGAELDVPALHMCAYTPTRVAILEQTRTHSRDFAEQERTKGYCTVSLENSETCDQLTATPAVKSLPLGGGVLREGLLQRAYVPVELLPDAFEPVPVQVQLVHRGQGDGRGAELDVPSPPHELCCRGIVAHVREMLALGF